MSEAVAITNTEYIEIEQAFQSLLESMSSSLVGNDRQNITNAYKLALEAHKYQRRKSGEPYIFHPIEVARIAYQEIGLGPTAVICAILHDVVEDTPVTIEEIYETFGKKVGLIVDGLTKLDGTYMDDSMESPQAENFKKVLSTLVEDVRVVLIKMADRIHNLRTIDSMPVHKKLKIAAETLYIYAPLAHRLGQYKIKTEFQDICMKIQEPELYKEIATKLKQSKDSRQSYINEFIKPLESGLNELNVKYRIIGRPKAISSIANKIKKKNIPFEEIYDLFAVRIIIDVPIAKEKSVCWQVYSVITDTFKPIPERLKDWVTSPKGNGYESLHTTVIGPYGKYVEVQIRSERMDEIAERGFAAHWKYKGVKSEHSVYDTWLDNVRDILDTQHNDALEFINDFKTNLFNEEVYAFTPKGDMRILAKGATALDFAFDIHTDIGYHAIAIKVNNKLVPMGYVLQNGDQVSVTTAKSQKPKEEWLKMAVTGKARSKIRSAMKEEKRKVGELAKEALQRKTKSLKIDFNEAMDFLTKYFGYKNRPDMYFDFATDVIKMTEFKKFEVVGGKLQLRALEEKEETHLVKEPKKTKKIDTSNSNLLIAGEPIEQYAYELATCCKPVQGDDVFGYLTSNNMLKVHRISCKNSTDLLANYGYRVLKAEWTKSIGNNYVVDLKVTGVDSGVGVIQSLTQELSINMGINIRSFSINGNEGYFEGMISIVVINKDQLKRVLMNIEKLPGISSVVRLNKTEN